MCYGFHKSISTIQIWVRPTPRQGIPGTSQILGVTGNLWREDNKDMSPPRELPVETQAGGMKQMRKATGLRSSSQDTLFQLVRDNPSSSFRVCPTSSRMTQAIMMGRATDCVTIPIPCSHPLSCSDQRQIPSPRLLTHNYPALAEFLFPYLNFIFWVSSFPSS